MEQTLKIKKLCDTATLPTKANDSDAAYDLYASKDIILESGKTTLVPTGIAVQLPKTLYEWQGISCYARIAARSGLAVDPGLDVFGGVCDAGYRGEIKVITYNSNSKPYHVKMGERIGQLIITVILTPNIEEVEELDNGDRGDKGFGSSGK